MGQTRHFPEAWLPASSSLVSRAHSQSPALAQLSSTDRAGRAGVGNPRKEFQGLILPVRCKQLFPINDVSKAADDSPVFLM